MKHLSIIGGGRIGQVMRRCAEEQGIPTALLGRDEPVDGPDTLLVCTNADDLEAVIGATPVSRRGDLIFVQNGLLRPLLLNFGLESNTQGVLYLAAARRDGAADAGAPSLFFGPQAGAMVGLLTGCALPAQVVPHRGGFGREVAVKLAWIAIFGLLGQRFEETVGASAGRLPLVHALVAELSPVLSAAVNTAIDADALEARILSYSLAIPGFRASVKELRWRNGALREVARSAGLSTPVHDELLALVGAA